MLVARLEVWRGGNKREARQIAELQIENVVAIDDETALYECHDGEGGHVTIRHRRNEGAWALVGKAIAALLPEDPGDEQDTEHGQPREKRMDKDIDFTVTFDHECVRELIEAYVEAAKTIGATDGALSVRYAPADGYQAGPAEEVIDELVVRMDADAVEIAKANAWARVVISRTARAALGSCELRLRFDARARDEMVTRSTRVLAVFEADEKAAPMLEAARREARRNEAAMTAEEVAAAHFMVDGAAVEHLLVHWSEIFEGEPFIVGMRVVEEGFEAEAPYAEFDVSPEQLKDEAKIEEICKMLLLPSVVSKRPVAVMIARDFETGDLESERHLVIRPVYAIEDAEGALESPITA